MLAKTRTLLAAALTLLAGTLVSAGPAAAQEATTVTGCLSKGPSEGTYTLTGDDRKTVAVTSTTVKLDDHVGHTVTLEGKAAGLDAPVETGAVSPTDTGMAPAPGAARDTGMAPAPGAARDTGKPAETGMGPPGGGLNVTKVTHISPKCK